MIRMKDVKQWNSEVGPGVVLLVAELPASHKDTKLRRDKMPRLSMRNGEAIRKEVKKLRRSEGGQR
jgi:hypothetical protein